MLEVEERGVEDRDGSRYLTTLVWQVCRTWEMLDVPSTHEREDRTRMAEILRTGACTGLRVGMADFMMSTIVKYSLALQNPGGSNGGWDCLSRLGTLQSDSAYSLDDVEESLHGLLNALGNGDGRARC